MPLVDVPKRFFLVKGKGDSIYSLNAFDLALLDAGVGNLNLVKVSSILPPNAVETPPQKFTPGELISIAYAYATSYVKGEIIAAAVAVAIPQNPELNGLIMEHSGAGTAKEIEEIVIHKAEIGMKLRNYAIKEIKSVSIEHTTLNAGAVFAGVVIY